MQAKSSWTALWTPITLAYCASFLSAAGHDTGIIDCIADKINVEQLIKRTLSFSPDLLVVNTAFPTIKSDIYIASQLKSSCGPPYAALVGLCGTILKEELLEYADNIDFIAVGEPEWLLKDLARALENKLPLRDIGGLIFKDNGRLIINRPQDMTQNNIDDLPFPARDLLPNDRYVLPLTGEKFTLLSIGRGCPYNCIYCTANLYYGKTFRKRNIFSIVDEISECVAVHGISNFLFWGESFTMDPVYGESICDEIIRRNLKVRWSTTTRVDTLNEGLLYKMKQAGCALLGLGIESIEQQVLDTSQKGTSVKDIETAVRLVKNAGIRTMGHFVFGLPGETKETAGKTIQFALDSGIEYAQFYCAVPYPGTELGEQAKINGWIETKDRQQYDLSISIMRNETLSSNEIKKIRDTAYRKFYLRPKMAVQVIKEMRNLPSFFASLDFMKWIRAGK